MGTVFAHGGELAKDYPDTEAGRFWWAFDTLLALKERPSPKRLQEMMGQSVVNGGHLNGRLSKLYAEGMEREGYVRLFSPAMQARWTPRTELPKGVVAVVEEACPLRDQGCDWTAIGPQAVPGHLEHAHPGAKTAHLWQTSVVVGYRLPG